MTEFTNDIAEDIVATTEAAPSEHAAPGYEDAPAPVIESAYDRPGRWFIVHTINGHEAKVREALSNVVKARGLEDEIMEIFIPEEEVTEFKNGEKRIVQRKMFPSYILVRVHPSDDIFFTISQIPSVTGFVGALKNNPPALRRREVDAIIRPKIEGVEVPTKRRAPQHEFEINDTVQIKTGPFATFSGHISEINEDQLKVKVLVDIFGRETPVELDFNQVTKI
jgi:transcriptional antiterminator NusG